MSKSEKKQDASIVWFEIPADNPERAKTFYGNLFGWKINPFPGNSEYSHIDTGGADNSPDGALKKRKHDRRASRQLHQRGFRRQVCGQDCETRRENLHGKNRCAADGLFRRMPGY